LKIEFATTLLHLKSHKYQLKIIKYMSTNNY